MTQISTQHLCSLPPIDELKRLLQSLATLEVIMTADIGDYWFDGRWSKSAQVGI